MSRFVIYVKKEYHVLSFQCGLDQKRAHIRQLPPPNLPIFQHDELHVLTAFNLSAHTLTVAVKCAKRILHPMFPNFPSDSHSNAIKLIICQLQSSYEHDAEEYPYALWTISVYGVFSY